MLQQLILQALRRKLNLERVPVNVDTDALNIGLSKMGDWN